MLKVEENDRHLFPNTYYLRLSSILIILFCYVYLGKKVNGLSITWDVHRNRSLRPLVEDMNRKNLPLYETKEPLRGMPTKEHTRLIDLINL